MQGDNFELKTQHTHVSGGINSQGLLEVRDLNLNWVGYFNPKRFMTESELIKQMTENKQ